METQTRESALEKIKETLQHLGNEYESVTEETPITEILDSMDVFEFAIELEKTTEKSITDSSIESWETFKDVIDTYLIVSGNE